MTLYIDITEFLANPITTGIQRIGGEVCKYLPPSVAIPVRLHSGEYVALPSALIDHIGRYFNNPCPAQIERIRDLSSVARGKPVRLADDDRVLV